MTDDGVFRTDDLALATVLVSHGFRHTIRRLNSRKACWEFNAPDGKEDEFDDLIDSYEQFGCKVEPRSFVEELGRLRSELYLLVPGSRRRRSTPSPDGSRTRS